MTAGTGNNGGGNGSNSGTVNGGNATSNTGSGGGGSGYNSGSSVTNTSGNGGSGIVILKYPSSLTITIGAGLTGSTSTVGSNKITSLTAGTGNVSFA
jgi:hypothetical protein